MVKSILPLHLNGAVAKMRGKTLVGPVDLTIEKTGFTIVMGPNGSGKTTLLRLIHGLQRLAAGQITWNEPDDLARTRQAYVFQTPIMMRRTVLDNIAFPLRLHGVGKADARAQATKWAKKIGLGHAIQRGAPVLSGGEKQKLSLARALIRQPDILFLDEPCANLDGRAMRDIEELLLDANKNDTRIIMATHDMGQARRLATEVIFMYGGKIHEAGRAEEFFAAPKTTQAAAFIKGDIVE